MILLWLPLVGKAQSPEDKGLMIAQEAEKRDSGFGDMTARMTMILKNRHGQEGFREIRFMTIEVQGDGDKNLSIFDDPRNVRGMAFLTFTHKNDDDDQWLFLPALKRVKRISAHNKSGSFMGSEFAYEDITSQETEKYTYKWIKDDQFNGLECYIIERYPVDKKNSGYVRQVAWIDKKEYRQWKVDYYDRKNTLLKTLTVDKFDLFMDRYWRADTMNMINHQTGKSTRIEISNYQFQVGLSQNDFTKSSLRRVH